MKIMLAMPTLGILDVRMASFLYSLLKSTKHQLSIVHTQRTDICAARNTLIRDFLKTDNEYLLFLDDDNIPEDVGFLDKMLEAKKPVVSALVPSRTPDGEGRHRLCVFYEHTQESGIHKYDQLFKVPRVHGLFPIANCGMGCVLIEREVVKLVAEEFDMPCEMRMCWYYWCDEDNRWLRDDVVDYAKIKDGTLRFRRYMSEDLIFFERAKEFGVQLWAHEGVRCTHIGLNEIISIKTHICSQS